MEQEQITVIIQDQEYKIKCDPNQVDYYKNLQYI